MPKNTNYCSMEPLFPKSAFMLYVFVLQNGNTLGTVPVDAIYKTAQEASLGVMQTIEQFSNVDKVVTLAEECLLFPLRFESLYPLKEEYWKNPQLKYTSHMRMNTFNKVMDYPSFFSLLVTPLSYDDSKKSWLYHPALPLNSSRDISLIEKFMRESDHVVEPRAKNAAIYRIDGKLRFNWKDNKIKIFKNISKKLALNEN